MTVATSTREARAGAAHERLLVAVPLITVFACLAFIYAWQGSRLASPWTFYDELYYTRLARSLVGHESLNLQIDGVTHAFTRLYAVAVAPAWLFPGADTTYAIVKYVGALVMTAAIFPTFLLARTVVSRPFAFFAAAGTVAVPALAYSSQIMAESLAYPLAALCFLLTANALATRRWAWIAPALVACSAAPFVRSELVILPAALVLAVALFVLTTETARERWSRSRVLAKVAVVAAALALAVVAVWVLSRVSVEWSAAVDRSGVGLDYVSRAGGALVVGMGFLPAIAALALLASPARLLVQVRVRAFACVFIASLGACLLYTGVKAAYLTSVHHANPVEERNLIYLVPLLFPAAAVWLEQRRASVPAIVAAALVAGWAVFSVPLRFPAYPASDAPSFAVIARAHSEWSWSSGGIRAALLAAVAVSAIVLLALPRLRKRPGALGRFAVAAVCAAVVGWALTAEFYANAVAAGFSRETTTTLPRPLDWIDGATHGGRAVYIGQRLTRTTDVELLSFWNRSVVGLFTLDAPPNGVFARAWLDPGGRLTFPTGARFVVADAGVVPLGRRVVQRGRWTVYSVQPPIRIASAAVGVFADRWMGRNASYWFFTGNRRGTARVTVSRELWCRPSPPATVTVTAVHLSGYSETRAGRRTTVLQACATRDVALSVAPPFRIDVHVDGTFVPAEADRSSVDRRRLGAQARFSFQPGA